MRYTLIKQFLHYKNPVYVFEPNVSLEPLKLNNCVVVTVPNVCQAVFPLLSFQAYINHFAYDENRGKIQDSYSYYYSSNSFPRDLTRLKATYKTYFQGNIIEDEKVCYACPNRLALLTSGETDQTTQCYGYSKCQADFNNYPFTWNKTITKQIPLSLADKTGASRRVCAFSEVSPTLEVEKLNIENRKKRGNKGANTRKLGKTKCVGCFFEKNCTGKERNERKVLDCNHSKKALNRALRRLSVRRFGSYEKLLDMMKYQGSIVNIEESSYWNSKPTSRKYEVVCPINKDLYLATPVQNDDRKYKYLQGKLIKSNLVTQQVKSFNSAVLDRNAKILLFAMAVGNEAHSYYRHRGALANHKPPMAYFSNAYRHNFHFNNNTLVNVALKRGSISLSLWEDIKSIRHMVEVFKEYGRSNVIRKLIGKEAL